MSEMRFRNFGGIHQFMVSDEADLARIDEIDPARWAATSAPLHDLHCDPGFLRYVDHKATGRVRVAQIIEARDWLFARLAQKEVVRKGVESIAIAAVDEKGEAGAALRAAADRVNREQKVGDAKSITLDDVRAYKGAYQKLLANGDGVIPADVIPEEVVKAFITDVIEVVGSTPDRGGSPGIDADRLKLFMTQGQAWVDWRAKAAAERPWGDDTDAALALVRELDPKIEAYFLQCELLRQEAPTADSLRLAPEDLRALRAKAFEDLERHVKGSPLAAPSADGTLPLAGTVNVLYRDRFEALRDTVIRRVLGAGAGSITRAEWLKVKATFDGYVAWEKGKPAEPFDKLGDEKMKAHLAGGMDKRVEEYIALDLAAAKEIGQIDDLEKVLLYVRWLIELVNNFVNFSAVYLPKKTALVEAGSLVIDGRRLDFCLKVANRAAHKSVATLSNIYLVYVEVLEKEGGEVVYQLVAPVTGGEAGRLRVGKRGIFIDLDDKEFDAIVTEIVDNPISVKQAAFAPFRRAAAMISSKVEEYVANAQASQEATMNARAQASVAATQAQVEAGVTQVGTGVEVARGTAPVPAAPATPPPTEPTRPEAEPLNPNSLILGGGMALAGLGAVLAGIFGVISSVKGWLAIIGVVLVVMGISALLGWMKLRRRDMALLFEASGWAVNVHMTITRPIARVFAFVPDLPREAVLDRADMLPGSPEDEDHTGRTVVLVILLAALLAAVWFFRRRILGLMH
ncbi:MAG: uncharacterized protein JWM10_2652 [Myxococcaceae bacterium]|nr:uncharacterized protein [Myxococcaceae bacterium]